MLFSSKNLKWIIFDNCDPFWQLHQWFFLFLHRNHNFFRRFFELIFKILKTSIVSSVSRFFAPIIYCVFWAMVRAQVFEGEILASYKSNFALNTLEKTHGNRQFICGVFVVYFHHERKNVCQNWLISLVCAFWFFSLAKKMSCRSSGFSIAVQKIRIL